MEFDELLAICNRDPVFPRSWAAWNELLVNAKAAAIAAGSNHAPLRLDPQHFMMWCASVAIIPCIDALRAYAIIHRSPMSSARYGQQELDSRPGSLS